MLAPHTTNSSEVVAASSTGKRSQYVGLIVALAGIVLVLVMVTVVAPNWMPGAIEADQQWLVGP
jgi:hypothetical protein